MEFGYYMSFHRISSDQRCKGFDNSQVLELSELLQQLTRVATTRLTLD